MSQASYLVMALGVLNLLLVASGFLLVFFDWSAARRREFLYLYFTEEKPGVNYFAAARRRRAQYTRLLGAFGVLFVHALIAAIIYAAISKPADWNSWATWWSKGLMFSGISDPDLKSISQLQVWMFCLEMLGLALLGLGFLFRSQERPTTWFDYIAGSAVLAWGVFILLVASGLLDIESAAVARATAAVFRIIVVGGVVVYAMRRRDEPQERGLLAYDPMLLSVAFGVWLIGALLSDFLSNPAVAPMGQTITYLILVGMVARGVLTEYETVESSRHRLGRERQVIVSFLRRIGAAFTTEVEVDQVLRIIMESALDTTEASAGAIYLYHAESRLLEPRVVLHFFPPLYVDTPAAQSPHRTEELEEEMKHQSFRLGEGVIGTVAQTGHSQIIHNVQTEGVMLGTTAEYMRNKSMLVVPLRIRDEPLGVMAVLNKQRSSFNAEDLSLLQALADQGALFINNAILTIEVGQQQRLQRELQIARDIQQRLLPKECPIVPGFEIAARGTSATEVGGDYYDFFWVDDDHLGIVVADVSGKGVHAALVVAMIRSAFRTQARGNPDVGEVMSGVNEYISEDLRRDMFITCVYGILEVSTKKFSWARAGHEPIIVAHPVEPTELLSPDGFALGVIGSPDFRDTLEVKTVELHSGDRVLLFTDGLTEAMNAEGEEFGMQRVLEIMDHTHVAPLEIPINGTSLPNIVKNGTSGNSLEQALSTQVSRGMKEASPCAPEHADNEPEDLLSIERAVELHVGDAAQSDDLTIVYVAAT